MNQVLPQNPPTHPRKTEEELKQDVIDIQAMDIYGDMLTARLQREGDRGVVLEDNYALLKTIGLKLYFAVGLSSTVYLTIKYLF